MPKSYEPHPSEDYIVPSRKQDGHIKFDPDLAPDDPEFFKAVRDYTDDYTEWKFTEGKKPGPNTLNKMHLTMGCILAHMVYSSVGFRIAFSIPKDDRTLKEFNIRQKGMRAQDFKDMLKWLEKKVGYVAQIDTGKSFKGWSVNTLWELTDNFNRPDLKVILIKDKSSRRWSRDQERGYDIQLRQDDADGGFVTLDFPETEDTTRWRSNLKTINECLLKHDVTVNLSDKELRSVVVDWHQFSVQEREHSWLDLSRKTLTRAFRDGFQSYGRFSGGFWIDLNEDYRKKLLIDGQETIEADFKSFQLSALRAIVNEPALEDAYEIEGMDRKQVKRMMTMWINSKGKKSLATSLDVNVRRQGYLLSAITWEDAKERVERHLGPKCISYIHECWDRATLAGARLQRLDAEIAEGVMMDFVSRDIPILGIHDSFVVQQTYKDDLVSSMSKHSGLVLGREIPIDLK